MKGSCGGGGANFGKFKGKVGSKIFRFFSIFAFFPTRGSGGGEFRTPNLRGR